MSSPQNEVSSDLLPDEDLLNELEIQVLSADYKQYYKTRKQNFLAIIQRFPMLWEFYQSLDAILLDEFRALEIATDIDRMFPVPLFFNAHAKVRLSVELAFSGCMPEAHSLMRDAIEFVAHAHALLADASLQSIWLDKNEDAEAFKDAFERRKKTGIFKDLPRLHQIWGNLSEIGSHATINAICERFKVVQSENHVSYELVYCGLEERTWIPCLLALLLNFGEIEKVIYSAFETEFRCHDRIISKRKANELLRERLRLQIISQFNLRAPIE